MTTLGTLSITDKTYSTGEMGYINIPYAYRSTYPCPTINTMGLINGDGNFWKYVQKGGVYSGSYWACVQSSNWTSQLSPFWGLYNYEFDTSLTSDQIKSICADIIGVLYDGTAVTDTTSQINCVVLSGTCYGSTPIVASMPVGNHSYLKNVPSFGTSSSMVNVTVVDKKVNIQLNSSYHSFVYVDQYAVVKCKSDGSDPKTIIAQHLTHSDTISVDLEATEGDYMYLYVVHQTYTYYHYAGSTDYSTFTFNHYSNLYQLYVEPTTTDSLISFKAKYGSTTKDIGVNPTSTSEVDLLVDLSGSYTLEMEIGTIPSGSVVALQKKERYKEVDSQGEGHWVITDWTDVKICTASTTNVYTTSYPASPKDSYNLYYQLIRRTGTEINEDSNRLSVVTECNVTGVTGFGLSQTDGVITITPGSIVKTGDCPALTRAYIGAYDSESWHAITPTNNMMYPLGSTTYVKEYVMAGTTAKYLTPTPASVNVSIPVNTPTYEHSCTSIYNIMATSDTTPAVIPGTSNPWKLQLWYRIGVSGTWISLTGTSISCEAGNTYYIKAAWTCNMVEVGGSKTTSGIKITKPSMSTPVVSECSCTSIYITGTFSCGGTITYLYTTDDTNWITSGTGQSGQMYELTGLTPGASYRFKASITESGTVYEAIYPTSGYYTMPEVDITAMAIDDGETKHTQDFTLSKPATLTMIPTTTCKKLTVHYKYIYKSTEYTFTTDTFDLKELGTYTFWAFAPDYTNITGPPITVTLGEPTSTANLYDCTQTYVYGYPEVTDGSTYYVFKSDNITYLFTSDWDSQLVGLTRTQTFDIDGTVYTDVDRVTLSDPALGDHILTSTITFSNGTTEVCSVTNKINLVVIEYGNGTINMGTDVLYDASTTGTSSFLKVAGQYIEITALQWGDDLDQMTNTYTWNMYVSFNETDYVPATSDVCEFYSTGTDNNMYVVPYVVSRDDIITRYKVYLSVISKDFIGQFRSGNSELSTTNYIYCEVGIIPIVELNPDPHVGSVSTEFIGDATETYVNGYPETTTSYPRCTLSFEWKLLLGEEDVTDTKMVFLDSTTKTSRYIKFTINEMNTYTLKLTISGTYQTTESESPQTMNDSVVTNIITITEILPTGITDFDRFTILFRKGDKCFVASRESIPYFTELKFSMNLSNIGSMSCTLYGINKRNMDSGVSIADMFDEPGAYVCILDRLNPVWYGIVTEPYEVDTNYYSYETKVTVIKITAYEAIKELSYVNIDTGNNNYVVSGTLTDIVRYVIPETVRGDIQYSNVNYGISIGNISCLSALEQLYSQTGWKYRCRPDTAVYSNTQTFDGDTYTFTPTKYNKDIQSYGIVVMYNDSLRSYSCGFVKDITASTFGLSSSFNRPVLGSTVRYTVINSYLIDFKPTYYQKYDTRTWITNYNATDVDAVQNIRDKYSSITVYGVGNSGETISCTMKAWMPINKDYTIDKSMRITRSYDAILDSIVKIGEVTQEGKTYAIYNLTMMGWSFPDSSVLFRLSNLTTPIYPSIYYTDKSDTTYQIPLKYEITSTEDDTVDNPRRYYDQSANKKTSYMISVDTTAQHGFTYDTDAIESLTPLSQIITHVYGVDYPNRIPEIGESVCVGDSIYTVSNKFPAFSEFYVTNNISNPHGHLTDILVMKNDLDGYSYSNPHPDSPAAKYPNTSITIQGPEGYTVVELERLACRYMQYGSNYSAQGTATIKSPFFYKDDYSISAKRLPVVGDRIAIAKAGTETVSYELQKYEFDMDSQSVSIVFGMPIMNIGEVIYNMMSNSGMSILPSDS